jgi:hypothetical protein
VTSVRIWREREGNSCEAPSTLERGTLRHGA